MDKMSEVETLAGITTGMYKIYTETSSYTVNLDNKEVKRSPGLDAKSLEKDKLWFPFFSIWCQVGQSMFIWSDDVASKPSYTNRRTTVVTKIEPLIACGI